MNKADADISDKELKKSTEKDDHDSLTDSDSSYVIEEEIVEYELSDSDEEKSKKSSQKMKDKSNQSSFYNDALKIKEEEMKDKPIEDGDNMKYKNNDENIPKPKSLQRIRDEAGVNNSFKDVSDSMENIKTRLSITHLNGLDEYSKLNFRKTDTEFARELKKLRYIVSRINETHNSLKKALHEMKGNPFSISDDEQYDDLPSECSTEALTDVDVEYSEDKMFNIDEAEVFEKYIMFVDKKNREVFAQHYENLHNVDELFKKTIFAYANSSSLDEDIQRNGVEVAA